MTTIPTAVLGIVLIAAAAPALAQSAAGAPAADGPAAGSNDTIPEKQAPATDIGGKGGTLSNKLNQSDGVIRPQGDVDPAMEKPAPATGTTPVIPPPGSPGGAPGVDPK